jgi:chromosome partitioning protein
MVYVDPGPEIGSPPLSAGSAAPLTARSNPHEGGTTGRPEGAAQPGGHAPDPLDSDEAGARHPDQSVTGESIPSGTDHELAPRADSGTNHVQDDAGLAASSSPADGRTGDDTISGREDAEPSGSAADRPWSEHALPMALPPSLAPADATQGGVSHEDEVADPDAVLPPDPTWPRLFGPREQATPAVYEAADVPDDETDVRGGLTTVGGLERDGRSAGSEHTAQANGVPSGADIADRPSATPPVEPASSASQAEEVLPVPLSRSGTEAGSPSGQGSESAMGTGGDDPTDRANMSAGKTAADAGEPDSPPDEAGSARANVSRETAAGGGEEMDRGHGEDPAEDEAAVAVREAVSRAAAEAGVDVSRETGLLDEDLSIQELPEDPAMDPETAARNARVTFRIHRDRLNGHRRVLAVANQKGGVGKSTTAVNLGAYLALAGARVLVIDLDPQGNASTGLGLDHRDVEPSIYDVLTGETPLLAAVRATGVANLHVLPSTIDLAGAEVELVSAMSRETRLRRALQSIDKHYDTVLIDCPPSLGLLTVNALAAADELLIPIQCEYYALEGLGQLLRNVELVRANLNPDLRIGGIVLTMYDGRTRLALQVVDEVRKHFSDVVYQTVVPRSVRLSEAPGYGLPIALYDPLSRGGIAYRDLAFELAERSGLLAPTGEGAS